MKREFAPQIRVVSADHQKTISATQLLGRALRKHNLSYKILDVFCHLETSRCGLPADGIGLEVEGRFIFVGKEITPELAEQFCQRLPAMIQRIKASYGLTE